MSLVVAQATADGPRIVSDTHVLFPGPPSRRHSHKYVESDRASQRANYLFPLPEVRGSAIRIAPKDHDLETWVKSVDEVIEQANQYYRTDVLPRLHDAEKRQADAEAERKRRVEEGARRAKDL